MKTLKVIGILVLLGILLYIVYKFTIGKNTSSNTDILTTGNAQPFTANYILRSTLSALDPANINAESTSFGGKINP